jgi:hypothetical protein
MPIVNLTTSFLGIIPPNNPVVTFVSATGDSITVNITNPNEYSVKAYYGHTNPNPTLNTTISANSNQNVTVSGLTAGTNYIIYVYLENIENNSISNTVSVLGSTPAELYGFTTFTFTNAGATGRNGPTLAQCRTAYSSTSWTQNNSFFNMTTQGIQEWKVPATASYTIEAAAARGGFNGGAGARMIGTFSLTEGEVIRILVGQMGESSSPGGGGGGTFVVRSPYNSTAAALVCAGGGSGNGNYGFQNGRTETTGGTGGASGGSSGNGGSAGSRGSGGGGLLSNGGNYNEDIFGRGFVNGGIGGGPRTSCSFTSNGGFGGGSGGSGNCIHNGGAGGGYSGGGGSSNTVSGSGGSYNSGLNQSNTAGINNNHGYVTITKL